MLIHHSKNAMPKIGRFPGLVRCQTNMKNTSENSVQTQSQSPIAEFTRLFCHSCYKSSSGTPATLHPWRCPAINLLFFVTTHLSVSDMVPCAAVASCWHHLPKARVVNPQTKQGNPRTKITPQNYSDTQKQPQSPNTSMQSVWWSDGMCLLIKAWYLMVLQKALKDSHLHRALPALLNWSTFLAMQMLAGRKTVLGAKQAKQSVTYVWGGSA